VTHSSKQTLWVLALIGLAAIFFPFKGRSSSERSQIEITLEMGSAHVIKVKAAKQVAVGNSQLIQATAVSADEVILFAKRAGLTTVDVWTKQGKHHAYRVLVTAAGLEQQLQEVQHILSGLSNVRARLSGRHIVIDGQQLTTADQARLKTLLQRYPDIVDLTSQVAWDQMVLLDVQVLELPRQSLRDLGVNWRRESASDWFGGVAWSLGSADMRSVQESPWVGPELAAGGAAVAKGTMMGMNQRLSSQINALTQTGQAVLLAQPQLLARSGSAASFLAGGEVPYAQVDKDGKSSTIFKKYGVLLNVTPHVDTGGVIRAKVDVEVSAIDPTITTPAGPAMRVRKTSTEFNVFSGQTLVLGGFVSHEASSQLKGLPGASEIPGIGGLFGVTSTQTRQTEMAVFVTPILIDANHPDMMARVAKAQAITDQQIGQPPALNVPVRGETNDADHQWHPSHPGLSQWDSSTNHRSDRKNTTAWSESHRDPNLNPFPNQE
jgi:pilus assembly protein CpaC